MKVKTMNKEDIQLIFKIIICIIAGFITAYCLVGLGLFIAYSGGLI
jgi:hypothetical protein